MRKAKNLIAFYKRFSLAWPFAEARMSFMVAHFLNIFLLLLFAHVNALASPNGTANATAHASATASSTANASANATAGANATGEDLTGAVKALKLNETFFQPKAYIAEESLGGLQPIDWSFGLKTSLSNSLSFKASLGASGLLFPPAWSQSNTNQSNQASANQNALSNVSLLDATVEVFTDLGDLYGGQFLIPWGLEGTTFESDLFLPRSLFYERGIFPLRDIGAGFKTDYNGYFMNLAVHNGSGPLNLNNSGRIFATGQWGYRGAAHSAVGLSATVGHLSSNSILNSTVSQEEKIRGLNLFYGFHIYGLGLQFEASGIETRSDSLVTDSLSVHGDIEHPITDHLGFIGRYETLNPNLRVGAQVLSRAYAGCDIHSGDQLSRFFIFLVKNMESQNQTPGDEVEVAWRITPTNE
jgi:hypothetical protein